MSPAYRVVNLYRVCLAEENNCNVCFIMALSKLCQMTVDAIVNINPLFLLRSLVETFNHVRDTGAI